MSDNPEQETEKKVRRYPSRIARLVENSRGDAQLMRGAHQSFYGFDVDDKFARDLAAYVKNPAKTPGMLATGDAQAVREAIQEVYGFWVTVDYANDLLAFAEKQPKGDA